MYRHATYEQSEYVVMKELRKSNNLYEVLKVQNLYDCKAIKVILDSSMVEHSAVNRVVVGSSPTRGVFLIW